MRPIPRGDGKEPGERRTRLIRDLPTYVPKGLAKRLKAYIDDKLTESDGFTKPGSQKR